MSTRWLNLIALLLFLLIAPVGVFLYFTSPGMGYRKSAAGIIAGALGLFGALPVPGALRGKPSESADKDALPVKLGWGVLIVFVVVMGVVVAYFMVTEQ
jgi:hypothetical protein